MQCIAYFRDSGMGRYGLYPTPITKAFAWVGERGEEVKSEGDTLAHVQAVIDAGKRRSTRHGGAVGITGYPSGCSQAGKIDAIDDTPLYSNGAMDVDAIVYDGRVIYGSLFTPWACPWPRQ